MTNHVNDHRAAYYILCPVRRSESSEVLVPIGEQKGGHIRRIGAGGPSHDEAIFKI